jgi:hypothetical protein
MKTEPLKFEEITEWLQSRNPKNPSFKGFKREVRVYIESENICLGHRDFPDSIAQKLWNEIMNQKPEGKDITGVEFLSYVPEERFKWNIECMLKIAAFHTSNGITLQYGCKTDLCKMWYSVYVNIWEKDTE